MDDTLAFRNRMAENGFEFTLEEAEKKMKAVMEFQEFIYQKATFEPEFFEQISDLSLKEKQNLCHEFSERGIEVTPNELDDIVNLIFLARDGNED